MYMEQAGHRRTTVVRLPVLVWLELVQLLLDRSMRSKSPSETVDDAVKKRKIKRVKDKERIEQFSNYLDEEILERIKQAREGMLA